MQELIRTYARPYRRALAAGAVLTVVEVGLSLALPWPLKVVVDDVLASPTPPESAGLTITLAIAGLIALIAMASIADYAATRILSGTGLRIADDLRVAVLSRLQRQSLGFHSRHRVGDLAARVTNDVAYTQEMLVQVLATLVPNALLVVGMFVVMLLVDPLFTLLALLSVPPLVFATHRSRLQLREAARETRRADGMLASSATEDLSAIHLVQAFTLERHRLNRFAELSGQSLRAGLDAVRLQSRFAPMIEAASAVSTAVVLGFGAYRVLDGSMSLGLLLVFLTYLGGLYKPVKSLSKLSIVVSKGAAAAERIDVVLQTPIDILDRPGVARRRALRGTVRFENVSFSYGREPVLHELSFRIAEGQQVALVGPTGAGKSTVAGLIPRLFDVDEGRVVVDGLDVRDHALASLRRQIATVLQDSVLLEGTLRENIVCGLSDVTARDVERAARLALVDEFSSRLPDGLDTMVGERGASLSGGQRQRVAIARAILRDSPILILDEPTSALDAGSEELVLEALDNLPASRTRIVIAHRLSTIRSSDNIVVLEHGRLVESGSHDALMATDGAYARLVRLQRTHLRLATSLG